MTEKVEGMKVEGFLKSIIHHAETALVAEEAGFPESARWHTKRMLEEAKDVQTIVDKSDWCIMLAEMEDAEMALNAAAFLYAHNMAEWLRGQMEDEEAADEG